MILNTLLEYDPATVLKKDSTKSYSLLDLLSIHFGIMTLVIHCVKSVRIRSYSGPYFPPFRLNTDQNNSEYGHFLRSALNLNTKVPN